MRVVLGSVVYAQAEKYLDDFFESLENQTDTGFDILLINDNIIQSDAIDVYKKKFDKRFVIIDRTDSEMKIHELRIELLKQAKKLGYDLLVLCDCDDKCEENRIQQIKEQYDNKYSFFYNMLKDFNGNLIWNSVPTETVSIEQIIQENYLGLTNTTVVMKDYSDEFIDSLYQGNANIFDWYLFSRMLLNGKIGKRIDETYTYYRLYRNNLAGVDSGKQEEIDKEIRIKLEHYKSLEKYDSNYSELIKIYEKKQESNCHVRENKNNHFWWGIINENFVYRMR